MQQDMEWMKNRHSTAERAKADIIGAIFSSEAVSEIRYFDYEKCSGGNGTVYDEINTLIEQSVPDAKKQTELSNLIADYSYNEELMGFREGFSVAARIFIQGISGRGAVKSLKAKGDSNHDGEQVL